jgi:HD-like signal output (HDOD) protein/GGDEF domain-containing protein
MQVLELTNNREVDARALKSCIENDPALTSKLLRVVNSSLFGLTRQVSDLNQAIALLGSKPLKLLVLGFSLPAGLFAGVTTEVLAHYWRHSLTKAVAARELSQSIWHRPGDDVFIAALLQDVGLLLLVQQLGDPYVRFVEKVIVRKQDLTAMERASMGFDHTTLSARLLAMWGLPEAIVNAIAYRPSNGEVDADSSDGALATIVYLAELLARILVGGQTHWLGEILERGLVDRGMTRAELDALVDRLEEKVDQLAGVLRLPLSDGLDYRNVLVAAHGQLAQVASDAAEDILRNAADPLDRGEPVGLLSEFQAVADSVARLTRGTVAPPAIEIAPAPRSSGEEPAELGRQLAAAVAACRQSRCALSLMFVELDRAEELAATHTTGELSALQRLLETLCRNVDHEGAIALRQGTHGFALVLPDCERRAAVELGNRMIDQVGSLVPRSEGRERGVTLSVGIGTVSLPPKNFPAGELLEGARRCLYGSHASGGGVVKSIEIY